MIATTSVSRVLVGPAALAFVFFLALQARAQQAPVPLRQERGNLVFEGIPPLEASLAARLERYQQSRQASFLAHSDVSGAAIGLRFHFDLLEFKRTSGHGSAAP